MRAETIEHEKINENNESWAFHRREQLDKLIQIAVEVLE
jgi:hypothetical protein